MSDTYLNVYIYTCSRDLYECGPLWVVKLGVAWVRVRLRTQSQRAKTTIPSRLEHCSWCQPCPTTLFILTYFAPLFNKSNSPPPHADNPYPPPPLISPHFLQPFPQRQIRLWWGRPHPISLRPLPWSDGFSYYILVTSSSSIIWSVGESHVCFFSCL